MALLVGVPRLWNIKSTSSLSTSLRACSTVFAGAEAIVIGNEIDLSPVEAALGIELPEKGLLGSADQGVGRKRPAVGHDVADLDLAVGGALVVFLFCRRSFGTHGQGGSNKC